MLRFFVLACVCAGLQARAESLLALCGYSNSFLYHTVNCSGESLALPDTPNAFSPVREGESQCLIVHSGSVYTGEGAGLRALSWNEEGVALDVAALALPDFSSPWGAQETDAGCFVSLLAENRVVLLDALGEISASYNDLNLPQGVYYRESDACLFACESGYGSGNHLFWHNLNSDEEGHLTVGVNPQLVLEASDGYLYVLCSGSSWTNPPQAASLYRITGVEVDGVLALEGNPSEMVELAGQRLALADAYATGTPALQLVDLASFSLLPTPPLTAAAQVAQGESGIWVGTLVGEITCYSELWEPLQSYTTGAPVLDLLAVETESALRPDRTPAQFSLAPASPNPFNPSTWLSFELQHGGSLTLAVYNLRGQCVNRLAAGHFEAGTHRLALDGRQLASGVYLVQLQMAGQSAVERISLVR